MTRYCCLPILALAVASSAPATEDSEPKPGQKVTPGNVQTVNLDAGGKSRLFETQTTAKVLASPVMTEVSMRRNENGEWITSCKVIHRDGERVDHRHGDGEVH